MGWRVRTGQLDPTRARWAAACPEETLARRIARAAGHAPAELPAKGGSCARLSNDAAIRTEAGLPDVRWRSALLEGSRILSGREVRSFACDVAERTLDLIPPGERGGCVLALAVARRHVEGEDDVELARAHAVVDASLTTVASRGVDDPSLRDSPALSAIRAVRAAASPSGPIRPPTLTPLQEVAAALFARDDVHTLAGRAAGEALDAVAEGAGEQGADEGGPTVIVAISHWTLGPDQDRAPLRLLDGRERDLVGDLGWLTRLRLGLRRARFRFVRDPNLDAVVGVVTVTVGRPLIGGQLERLRGELRRLQREVIGAAFDVALPDGRVVHPRWDDLGMGPLSVQLRQVRASWLDVVVAAALKELSWQHARLCELLLALPGPS